MSYRSLVFRHSQSEMGVGWGGETGVVVAERRGKGCQIDAQPMARGIQRGKFSMPTRPRGGVGR